MAGLGAAAASVAALGSAWLASCILRHPTYAMAIGIFTPFVIVGVMKALENAIGITQYDGLAWYTTCASTLGIACFAIGTAYYLRQVEP